MEIRKSEAMLPGTHCVVITGDPVDGTKFADMAQELFEGWEKRHRQHAIRSFSFRPTWPDDNGHSNGNGQLVVPEVTINYIPAVIKYPYDN